MRAVDVVRVGVGSVWGVWIGIETRRRAKEEGLQPRDAPAWMRRLLANGGLYWLTAVCIRLADVCVGGGGGDG